MPVNPGQPKLKLTGQPFNSGQLTGSEHGVERRGERRVMGTRDLGLGIWRNVYTRVYTLRQYLRVM